MILFFASLISWPTLLPGYFSHHDDLQVMRVFEMRKCIEDLQIPCRWVPDMGYGYGYPLFNYYAVFPYYIGALFSFILGFVTSAKILFALPIFIGAISMYFFAKEIFGKHGGILASVLYTYAPYHALDLFVRGDIAESFAISIIPFCFYFALKVIKGGENKYICWLAVSIACFLTSHNIMTLLFLPVLFTVCLYWFILKKKNLFRLIFGLLIGVGLAAFFILPAFFEKNLVQIDNLIRLDLNFRAHFVTIHQLFFSRYWGYGASVLGPNDTISFQIGWPQWWFVIASISILIFNLLFRKTRMNFFVVIIIAIFFLSTMMTHTRSAFIWEKIDILKFTQFPWRFLSVTTFSTALLGAFTIESMKEKYKIYLLSAAILVAVSLNWQYFKPYEFYPNMTDQEKLSGFLWIEQTRAAILDYLPATAVRPYDFAPANPILITGNAVMKNFVNRSNHWQFEANIKDASKIELPIFDFPNWTVFVNDKKIVHNLDKTLQKITFTLGEGNYRVQGKFENTNIRTVADMLSLLSLVTLLFFSNYEKIFKKL